MIKDWGIKPEHFEYYSNKYHEIKLQAKHQVREYSGQQKIAKRQYKEGKITKEEWLQRHKEYDRMKKAIQRLFR